MNKKMKIVVIGSGISGLSCSWLLSKGYNVTLFEKNDYFGGHTNTQLINTKTDKKNIDVDTGFIVFNNRNYPNLSAFFNLLGVKSYNSNMSFGVSLKGGNLEYGGDNFNSMFAQRSNILNINFWLMIKDILKFYKNAELDIGFFKNLSIEEYLNLKLYSNSFKNNHLYPMAASIWSAPLEKIKNYPFENFINFFKNHGLLSLVDRPQWQTVLGGSKKYVEKILNNFKIKSFKSEEVLSINRERKKIFVTTNKRELVCDHVVFASHADEVLKILEEPSDEELYYLSMIKYQKNIAYLHSDQNFMPKLKKVWSSWNYIQRGKKNLNNLCVTYWMNKLQNLNTKEQIFVTLNTHPIFNIKNVYKKIIYSHPIYDKETITAQKGIKNIQGIKNTWFCGAYQGNGFHEDGIKSGLNIAEKISKYTRPWKK